MKCDKARELMSAAVDSELTSRENQAFTLHLQECSDCREEFEEAKKTKQIIQGKIVRFKAPQSLINSIMGLSLSSKKEPSTSPLTD